MLKTVRRVLAQTGAQKDEVAWISAGQAGMFLTSLAGVKTMTTILGPQAFGKLALGLTIAGILSQFAYGPVGQAILRLYPIADAEGKVGELGRTILAAHRRTAALVLVGALPATYLAWRLAGSSWGLIVVFSLLFGLVNGGLTTLDAVFTARRDRKTAAVEMLAATALRYGSAVAATLLFGRSGFVAMAGYAGGTLIVVLGFLRLAVRRPPDLGVKRGREAGVHIATAFHAYARPFVAFSAFGTVNMYADRWILQAFLGPTEVGLYAALFQISNAPVLLFSNAVHRLFAPILFQDAVGQEGRASVSHEMPTLRVAVAFSGFVLGLMALVALLFGHTIVALVTTSGFARSAGSLWILVLALGLFQVGQVLTLRGMQSNKPEVYLLPKAVQAISLVSLSLVLVPHLAVRGAALSLLVSSSVYVALVLRSNARLRAGTGRVD